MDKIICIGKNYLEHVRELADSSPNLPPVIFLKPPSVLQFVKNQHVGKLKYPNGFGSVHFETEIVLRISKECYKVPPEHGGNYFDAVSVGLDMTLRDLQSTQKKQGQPWTTSKVFPDSAVIGEWLECSKFKDFETSEFSFELDGVQKQKAKAHDMQFSCAKCVSYISQFFKLLPGDLVYTGTPAGVGPVQVGSVGKLSYGTLNYSVEWIS